MTNKEAIEALTSNVVENPELMYEALDMAIKALEKIEKIKEIINIDNSVIQEDVMKYKMICEVIANERELTKEEAIKMLKSKMDGNTDTSYEWAETVRMAIEALEQTRPIGKWKKISHAKIYECTNCYQMIMTDDINCYNYCYQCGADMR